MCSISLDAGARTSHLPVPDDADGCSNQSSVSEACPNQPPVSGDTAEACPNQTPVSGDAAEACPSVSDEMITTIAEQIRDWKTFARTLPSDGTGSPTAFQINDYRLDAIKEEEDSVERVRLLLWMWRAMSTRNNCSSLFDVLCQMGYMGFAEKVLMQNRT